jgi:putative tricarboxylic transport membrane protein
MLVLLAALTAQGFVPGPFMVRDAPELMHAAIAGLVGGTLILIVVGMRIASWMLHLSRIDRNAVLVSALAIVVVGIFAVRGNVLDVFVMIAFGIVGYFMYRYDFSPAAAALAVVLGAGFERSLRHGVALSNNSFVDLVSRPITASLLVLAVAVLVFGFVRELRSRRRMSAAETAADLTAS